MIQFIVGSNLFIPRFEKQNLEFKRSAVHIISTKCLFQILLIHENESIRRRKQVIQGLRCPNRLINQYTQEWCTSLKTELINRQNWTRPFNLAIDL